MIEIQADILARLGARPPAGCWLWPGAKTPLGYGKVGRNGRTLYVHRIMYECANGPIPNGQIVIHSCDVTSCCNPAHLSAGTHAQNSADMVAKGRSRAGEAHSLAKIGADDVRAIRRRVQGGETQCGVAAAYGLSKMQVSAIVRRLRWASVK